MSETNHLKQTIIDLTNESQQLRQHLRKMQQNLQIERKETLQYVKLSK